MGLNESDTDSDTPQLAGPSEIQPNGQETDYEFTVLMSPCDLQALAIAHSALVECGPHRPYRKSRQELNKSNTAESSSPISKNSGAIEEARFRTGIGCANFMQDSLPAVETSEGEGCSTGKPVSVDENRCAQDISHIVGRNGKEVPVGQPVEFQMSRNAPAGDR